MKTYKTNYDFYAEDFYREDYETSRRNGYYASNYFEQKEYSLESLSFQDYGFTISVRVSDLSSNEDYLMNRFVA